MQETAYAKVNLALHVRARDPDGYHRIETLFAFAEDGDRLSVEPAQDLILRIEGPFARGLSVGEDNLVMKAARLIQERTGTTAGAALLLEKRLPVASGIGGGSADAAATLNLLTRWWGVPLAMEMHELAGSLGADVPACVLSRTCRGEGRGDTLSLVDGLGIEGSPLLLVNPGVPLSTAPVFRAWDGVDRGPLGDFWTGRNDLEPAAIGLVAEISDVLAALRATGPRLARMSGSGATCFALYADEAQCEAAAAAIAAAHPHWWQLATCLR